MRSLLMLSMFVPAIALAGEHSVPTDQPLVIKVHRVGHEYIKFEVCEEGRCEPLAGDTGIFRVSELEARQHSLVNGSPEDDAAWADHQRRLNLAAWIGAGVVVLGNAGAFYLNAHGQPLPAYFTTLAGDAGLVPMVVAFFSKFLTRPLSERSQQANGWALKGAMDDTFRTSSLYEFRRDIAHVRSALHGVPSVTACEAGLY